MISPVGVVPKKEHSEFRMIHHSSWPEGQSVKDFIAREDELVQFASVDVAMALVRSCGAGAVLAKCDIRSAFRLLPVHTVDFTLLGIQFEGQNFVDKVLPVGCAISCRCLKPSICFYSGFVSISGYEFITCYLYNYLICRCWWGKHM